MASDDVADPGFPVDEAVLRAVLRDVLAVDDEVAARVADDLSTVLTVDRPDWAGRVGDVLARVGAGSPAVEDAEFRWFVDLVADVHLANPATWPELRWHPGPTTPVAGVDDVAAGFRAPDEVADRYDVVVVGSGAGGGVAAWKLAESGRRVLLVERGDWPGTAELARDHLRNPRAATGLDPLTGPRGAGDPRTLAGRVLRPGDGGWNANAMLVGGGTRVYGAQAWRFAPDDFRMATRYGVPDGSALADWPIGYADLEPYYDEVEWTLGVSGRAEGDTAAGPRRRPYPMPPLPGGVQERLLAAGAAALGLSTTAVPLLVNSREFGGRAACARCAQCVGFACPVDAKTGTHNTAVPWAVASGNCDVVPGARVDRVLPGTTGRVAGVSLVGNLDGVAWRRTVLAEEVVLAAGAVETARVLLSSAHDGDPAGMGNATDQVGRHLQGHVYGGATAVFTEEVVDLLGPGPAIATGDLRHGNPGLVGGGMLANEFVPTPANTRRALVSAGFLPARGPAARSGLRELARHLVQVVGPAQEVTLASSRVRLDPRVRDGSGVAVARFSGGIHDEDRRTQEFLSARAAEWLAASGASRVARRPPPGPGPSGGQHQAGTARMGTDPARSVTDPLGRVWGYRNLRVVDASLHVTNGGVNPVLTVLAGAARIADDMVRGSTRRSSA